MAGGPGGLYVRTLRSSCGKPNCKSDSVCCAAAYCVSPITCRRPAPVLDVCRDAEEAICVLIPRGVSVFALDFAVRHTCLRREAVCRRGAGGWGCGRHTGLEWTTLAISNTVRCNRNTHKQARVRCASLIPAYGLACLHNSQCHTPHDAKPNRTTPQGSGLSEGQWVTLGAEEVDDVEAAVEHLRGSGRVSTLGLWGRSMGAVTALLYAQRDPSIAGMVRGAWRGRRGGAGRGGAERGGAGRGGAERSGAELSGAGRRADMWRKLAAGSGGPWGTGMQPESAACKP